MKRTREILLLILLLACCVAPLTVRYDVSGTARIMENLAVMSSQETWMRQCGGEEHAWLLPTWNGRPRLNKPPMLVWLNMLSWSGLEWETSDIDHLVGRARLVAVGMALLALLGTYGCARCLKDAKLARLALLITGSCFVFVKYGRLATYDIHLLGWLMVALCMSFCAIGRSGGGMHSRRRILLWFPAALLLGGALLTKGPLALLFFGCPVALFILCFSLRRWRDLGLLAGCIALAGAVYAAWYGLVFLQHPEGFSYLLREYGYPLRVEAKPIWYYLILPAWMFPWSFWLIAACIAPVFIRPAREDRHWLLVWLWFVCLFLFMSFSPTKSQRYLLPLIPAGGILLAVYFTTRDQIAQLGWARVSGVLSVGNWLVVGVFCLGVPLLFMLWPVLGAEGTMVISGYPDLPDVPVWGAGLLLAMLVVMLSVALRFVRRGNITCAVTVVALLTLLASTVAYYSYSASRNNGAYPHRADAEKVRSVVEGGALYYLSYVADEDRIDPFTLEKKDRDPDKEFLIYYRGIIPAVTETQIQEMLKAGIPFFVCARDTADRAGVLDGMKLRYCLSFEDGGGPSWKLFAPKP